MQSPLMLEDCRLLRVTLAEQVNRVSPISALAYGIDKDSLAPFCHFR